MTTLGAEQEISRKTFYALRARARAEGQAAVLEPRSRRPRTSPTRLSEATADQAVAVRASLELSGLDHGPVSVHDKMVSMGLEAPSVASLARVLAGQGRGPRRAQEEAPSGLEAVRLPRSERLLAAGLHRESSWREAASA